MESADEAVAKLRGLGGDDPCGRPGRERVFRFRGDFESFARHVFRRGRAAVSRARADARVRQRALEACERSLRALGCVDGLVNPDDAKAAEKACAPADPRRARARCWRAAKRTRATRTSKARFSDLRVAFEVIEPVANRGSAEANALLSEIREKTHLYERDRRAHEHDRDHFAQLDGPRTYASCRKIGGASSSRRRSRRRR